MKSACEWCKEHWKLIATIVIVAVAVVLICTGVAAGAGAMLLGACWGAILGACIGGVSGGLDSMAQGGSFLDGFEDGAFSGAIGGAIGGAAFAGLGQLGAVVGKGVKCASTLGKCIKGTAAVTKVMSTAMGGFDTIALLDKAFGNGDIAALNAKLHESKAYNFFQTGVSAVAAFTGGMSSSMTCFVAGTLVMTASGLMAIENIKIGDLVVSADPDTIEISNKPVIDAFSREVDRIVHLTISGEEITTTFDHPFYVKGKGFLNATNLWIGAELISMNGKSLVVENIFKEYLEEKTVKVYNFKVDDYHTYFVGNNNIWVHNADCMPTEKQKGFVSSKKNPDGSITVTKTIDGKNVDIKYTKASDGHYYPRFEDYADYTNPSLKTDFSKPIKVNGKMNGNYGHDAGLINNQLGLSETPTGYVWHHIEDGKSMLLVQQKIHSIKFGGFTHKGGASIIRGR